MSTNILAQRFKISLLFLISITFLLTQLSYCQYDLQDYGVIIDNEQKANYHWGTYKPNLYFSMKNRRNTSQVFGLMWYGSGKENFEDTPEFEKRLRHDCKMEDDLQYHWEKHNGLDYGREIINDKKLNLKLTTTFIKNSFNFTNQSWDAIIEGEILDQSISKNNEFKGEVALLLYNTLENNHISDKAYYSFLPDGTIESQEKGRKEFHMKYIIDQGEVLDSSIQKYRKVYNETWRVKQFVSEDLKNSENKINDIKPKIRNIEGNEVHTFEKNPEWIRGKFITKNLKTPNIVVQQYIFKKSFRIFVRYSILPFDKRTTELSVDDLKYIREEILSNDKKKSENFDKKFNEIFPILPNNEIKKLIKNGEDNIFYEKLKKMSQQALSNVLGGIGHFYGAIKINFGEKLQPGQYHKGFRYAVEEKELLTGTPSRPFFPRGFLWDEGFHNILISKWDVKLSIDIINTWLSTMSATGWMAREQIRGSEAESKVPNKFIMQDKLMANPPTLIFALNNIMNYYKNNFETKNLKKMSAFLKKCNDKFSSWYEWFEIYQRSSDRKSYQWYGRTSSHNLASGLDDFPRAQNPNMYEKHLDLNIWIVELLKSLKNLSEIFDYELMQHFNKRIEKMQKELRDNFFDPKKKILADYLGPQYKLINSENFKEPVPPIFWRGDGKCGPSNPNKFNQDSECDPYSDMPCCSEYGWCGNSNAHCKCEKCHKAKKLEERGLEKENIFNPHYGYVNLYPIFFGFLKKDDIAFRNLLNLLKDEQILNSPYGIRSLSQADIMYHSGEDYWRGNIWINLNYLTLKGLKVHYYDDEEAMHFYNEMRIKLIETVFRNWEETGMFYEQYSDTNGNGLRAKPFNGWSSLILEIITERYEE